MEPVGAPRDQANAGVEGFDTSAGEATVESIEDRLQVLVDAVDELDERLQE
jgi:hypothetical protein